MTYKEVLKEAKGAFELKEDFRVRIKSMKIKAASISFKSRTIRINRELAADTELLRYLVYHELAHYKLGSEGHGRDFYKLLYSKLDGDFVKKEERRVIEKMLRLNGFRKLS
jgi:predicted metal-dependent hydrolase